MAEVLLTAWQIAMTFAVAANLWHHNLLGSASAALGGIFITWYAREAQRRRKRSEGTRHE